MNPHLQRHVWTELTFTRLLVMPAVLAIAFIFVAVVTDFSGEHTRRTLSQAALVLFVAIVHVWGSRLAADAILREFMERTWDWQRLSPQSPGSLTWGKLLGSPVYTWYGGIWCLAVFFLTSDDSIGLRLQSAGLLCVAGLGVHASSLLASLQTARKLRLSTHTSQNAYTLLSLLFVWVWFLVLSNPLESVLWFGRSFELMDFALVTVGAFTLWAVVGLHRLVRLELQMRSGPMVWVGFVAFLSTFSAGFVPFGTTHLDAERILLARVAIAYGLSIAFVYLLAFGELKTWILFRRLGEFWRNGNWSRFGHELPLFLVTLALAAPIAIGLLFLFPAPETGDRSGDPRVLVLGILLLATRDMALLLGFHFAANPRRPEASFLLCAALLYWILPSMAERIHPVLTGLFWPTAGGTVGLLFLAVETLAVAAWARARWTRVARQGELASSPVSLRHQAS